LPFLPFTCWLGSFGIRSQLGLRLGFQVCGRLSGTRRPRRNRPDGLQLFSAGAEELQAAALEVFQGIEQGEAQPGSSMASHLLALGRHVTQRMRRALHLGSKKPLEWWCLTTGLISGPSQRATSSSSASAMRRI
jgi:hypothetical protein